MRIRSARTLVFSRDGGAIVAFNFLTNSAFSCSHDLMSFLACVDDWTPVEEVRRYAPQHSDEELRSTIGDLLSVNALTAEESELAEAEEEYQANWKWGVPAALFHFSLQDREYMSLEDSEVLQREKLTVNPQPPLYLQNSCATDSTLPLPSALERNDLLRLMASRRTVRSATPAPIALAQLSDCLFAGLGIVGQTENCVGTLPLSMTPSGGARNPYEAYVYARHVDGLEPGFYHYSGYEHSLARLPTDELPDPAELMGGQDWTNAMPCVVFLCAFFERTMWKYDDANAYRVVLIEAGHIGQNLMLAATQHGLSACPSAALNHAAINRCIEGGSRFTHAPIYALTLAQPPETTH